MLKHCLTCNTEFTTIYPDKVRTGNYNGNGTLSYPKKLNGDKIRNATHYGIYTPTDNRIHIIKI